MDSLASYGQYAKQNPKTMITAVAAIVVLILAIIVLYYARQLDSTKITDPKVASAATNVNRAAMGLSVMALIGGVAGIMHLMSKK